MSDTLQDGSTINGDRIVHETAEADDERFIVHQSRGEIVGINLAEFDALGSAINNLAGDTGIETVIVPEGEHRFEERFNDLGNIRRVVGMGEESKILPHETAIADGNDSYLRSHTNYESVTFVAEVDGTDSARIRVTDHEIPNRRLLFRDCFAESQDKTVQPADRVFDVNGPRVIVRDCTFDGELRISPGAEDLYIDGCWYENLNISGSATNVVQGENFQFE